MTIGGLLAFACFGCSHQRTLERCSGAVAVAVPNEMRYMLACATVPNVDSHPMRISDALTLVSSCEVSRSSHTTTI